MTQYAVLGLWTAAKHGVQLPEGTVEKVCNWLMRTQDPSGAWGYQGKDPGPSANQRVQQSNIRHSLAAAGLGSAYICNDLLNQNAAIVERSVSGLPKAFLRVDEEGRPKLPRRTIRVSRRDLRAALNDGNRWFDENFEVEPQGWVAYYLYALERYQSFRELIDGPTNDDEWFDVGVKFLQKRQDRDGSFAGQGGRPVTTAFAILFLTRSTRQSIEKTGGQLGDGVLSGGRGLPKNTANIRLQQGKVVPQAIARNLDEMLTILEDASHEDYHDAVRYSSEFTFSKQPEQRAAQADRLHRLAKHGPADARLMAIQTLVDARDMDFVPTLILALDDPDLKVMRAARDGLRRISRKFVGYGLPDDPTSAQRLSAVRKWRSWYHRVRPDRVLLD